MKEMEGMKGMVKMAKTIPIFKKYKVKVNQQK
jgi:hypothetical protein